MKNLSKIIVIIIVNIIAIIALFYMTEGILYIKEFPIKKKYFDIESIEYKFRFSGLNYKKPPILIYGCSYGYGAGLKDNEHIGYILSEQTKRPVYNFSLEARGMQHALYIIKNQEPIKQKPEYAIYVYIDDHIRRLYMTCMKVDPYYLLEYEEKNGTLQQKYDKLAFIKNTLIYKNIFSEFIYPHISQEKKFKLLYSYLKEMKRELNIKYPGIKFVFLIYNKKYNINIQSNLNITDEMIKEIEKLGIDVIDLETIFADKLYMKKYRYVGNHPSKKAWEEIVPHLIQIENM